MTADVPAKSHKRNHFGVKNSADLYRTIKGEHYLQWTSEFDNFKIASYRVNGVRCAQRGGELFVHFQDQDAAAAVDEAGRKP